MKKSELKSLVKSLVVECLREILTDAVSTVQPPAAQISPLVALATEGVKRPAPRATTPQRQPVYSTSAVVAATGVKDPILASILADTAATTLPRQLAEESRPAGAQPDVDLNDILPSGNLWESLAFSEKKNV
jgi:hypothetical protein